MSRFFELGKHFEVMNGTEALNAVVVMVDDHMAVLAPVQIDAEGDRYYDLGRVFIYDQQEPIFPILKKYPVSPEEPYMEASKAQISLLDTAREYKKDVVTPLGIASDLYERALASVGTENEIEVLVYAFTRKGDQGEIGVAHSNGFRLVKLGLADVIKNRVNYDHDEVAEMGW